MKENEKKDFNEKVEIGLTYYDLCFIIKSLTLFRFSYSIINDSVFCDSYIQSLIIDFEEHAKEDFKHD